MARHSQHGNAFVDPNRKRTPHYHERFAKHKICDTGPMPVVENPEVITGTPPWNPDETIIMGVILDEIQDDPEATRRVEGQAG